MDNLFKPYGPTGLPAAVDRDPDGVYFLRTVNGYKIYTVANTAGKEFVELDMTLDDVLAKGNVGTKNIVLSNAALVRESFTGGARQVIMHPCNGGIYNSSFNGYFCIKHAIVTDPSMMDFSIKVFSYGYGRLAEIRVSFYLFGGGLVSAGKAAYLTINGYDENDALTAILSNLRAGVDATNGLVYLCIGSDTATWPVYTRIEVESINITPSANVSWQTGWSVVGLSTLSGIATIVLPCSINANRQWVAGQNYLTAETDPVYTADKAKLVSARPDFSSNGCTATADYFPGNIKAMNVISNFIAKNGAAGYPAVSGVSGTWVTSLNIGNGVGQAKLILGITADDEMYWGRTQQDVEHPYFRGASREWALAQGWTANETDAYLLDRTNHTGTQAVSTVSGLQDSLDNKVDKITGKGLSTEDYTTAEKAKVAGLESSHFKGQYTSLSALQAAAVGGTGNYAYVDAGAGSEVQQYIWDDDLQDWVQQAGASTAETPASIKTKYESNPDTNAYTDTEKVKLGGLTGDNLGNADMTVTATRTVNVNSKELAFINAIKYRFHISSTDELMVYPGALYLKFGGIGSRIKLKTSSLGGGDKDVEFQNQSGTLALLSDIPDGLETNAFDYAKPNADYDGMDTAGGLATMGQVVTGSDVLAANAHTVVLITPGNVTFEFPAASGFPMREVLMACAGSTVGYTVDLVEAYQDLRGGTTSALVVPASPTKDPVFFRLKVIGGDWYLVGRG